MIARIIILLLCTTNIYAQDKSIEFEIFLAKDTVRLFEPIEYCFKMSNTSDDTIRISSLKFGNNTKPQLEIRSKKDTQWVTLWHSDMHLQTECNFIHRGGCIYRIPAPKGIIKIQPNHIYRGKSIYFPRWKELNQNLFKESGTYEIRISPYYSRYKGLVNRSIEKTIYLKVTDSDKRFLQSLEDAELNTLDLYKSWSACIIDSIRVSQFVKLKEKHPTYELSDWIEIQYSNKRIRSYGHKKEKDAVYDAIVLRQKEIILKMIDDSFFPIDFLDGYYQENYLAGAGRVYDASSDTYFEEMLRFSEQIEQYNKQVDCSGN